MLFVILQNDYHNKFSQYPVIKIFLVMRTFKIYLRSNIHHSHCTVRYIPIPLFQIFSKHKNFKRQKIYQRYYKVLKKNIVVLQDKMPIFCYLKYQ